MTADVGAGTAGSVLANRLSVDATVLVIEAGPLATPPETEVPSAWPGRTSRSLSSKDVDSQLVRRTSNLRSAGSLALGRTRWSPACWSSTRRR